jgi:HK97 family phage major capsid protein
MTDVLDQLTARRDELRAEADQILTRATGDLAGADATRFTEVTGQMETLNARIDELGAEALRRNQLSDAITRVSGNPPSGARVPRGPLSDEARDVARAFRSAIYAKNPAPIEVFCTRGGDEWPEDLPAIQTRCGQIRLHTRASAGGILTRDTLTSTPTQALPVDVYSQIVSHLVESSAILGTGATVVTTDTGEELLIPKSTAFMASRLTAEGAPITESDPTLDVVTLKSYKYASLFQVSHELANDTPTNLLDFLAQAAGESLALAFGDDLINGDGANKPTGLLTTVATGVTGPLGTDTSLGVQGTEGQGTDALYDLIASVAEPYTNTSAAGFLLRNASDIVVRKLKDTTGQPVAGLTERGRILGYPSTNDGFMPVMAAGAKSIVFGDWSRYFARIVNGVRFERSDEFAFDADLVTFRAVIRIDGAQVDLNALKAFVNGSATGGARSKS